MLFFPPPLKIKPNKLFKKIHPQITTSLVTITVFQFLKCCGGTHFGGGVLALLEFGLCRGEAGWGWAPGQG